MQVCSICNEVFSEKDFGFGNNAQPVNSGRCCDDCNLMVVIPTRLFALSNPDAFRALKERTKKS